MKYIINSFSWVISIFSVHSSALWGACHVALAVLYKDGGHQAAMRAQVVEPRSRTSPSEADAEIFQDKGRHLCLLYKSRVHRGTKYALAQDSGRM